MSRPAGDCFGQAVAEMTVKDASCVQCRCMDRVQAMEPKWGVLYFAYDWFSAIRTDMAREVRCVLPLLSYAISCTRSAYICSARIFVRASTIGSAPSEQAWCGILCAHPHTSHQALCTSLQHPRVSVGGDSTSLGRLHTDCTLSCEKFESVLKRHHVPRSSGPDCGAGTTPSSQSTCRTATSTLACGAQGGRRSSTVTSAQT